MRLRVEEKVGHKHTRASNRRLIFQLLFRSKSYSRADLARLTGLTPATVSSLVGSLIDEGLVCEDGLTPVKVGKPSMKLALNGRAFTSICADLSSRELRIAILDLNGNCLSEICRDSSGASGEDIVRLVGEAIADVLSDTQEPVLGVGLGLPGIVTPTGTVIEASNLGLYDFNFAEVLQKEFDLPIMVSNDANATVLAEYFYADSGSRNLIAIKVGSGVGAGIISNGNLHFGEVSAAGEIGHIVVEDDGPPCRCGNRGCLETFLSMPILRQAAVDDELLEITGQRLGKALASLVSILDIHKIVVAETELAIQDQLCAIALSTLKKYTLTHLSESVDIQPSKLGKDAVLLGVNLSLINAELGVV